MCVCACVCVHMRTRVYVCECVYERQHVKQNFFYDTSHCVTLESYVYRITVHKLPVYYIIPVHVYNACFCRTVTLPNC